MAIDLGYRARQAFIPFHTRKERFACIVAHRRAGKTVASTLDGIDHALRSALPEGRYAYIAPYYAQAKDIVWSYVKQYTWQIPGVQTNESELRVDLPNGARFRLYGADNYDRMRGIYLDGAIIDEPADQPPQAWREVIRPALADRQGWATFIGTPKGKNEFYKIYQRALTDPDWFALKLKASETGLIPQSELDALRAQMSPNEYNREMECDFDAAIEGAYYAEVIAEAERDGRIGGNVQPDKLLRLRAYCDIGGVGAKADAFSIWICQFIGREIRCLNYYEAKGQELSAHVAWLRANGYPEGAIDIKLPHDGAANKGPYAGTWEQAFRDAGYNSDTIIGSGSGGAGAPMVRIEAGRRLFPRIWFDAKCKPGVDALSAYHEKRDEKRGIGLGVNHDWASHGADSFGLMCVDYEEPTAAVKLNFGSAGWMAA